DADQRRKLAMEPGRMGAWEWTIETNQVRWTTSLDGTVGRAPATFAGTFESFVDDIHPADRARVVETIRTSLTADHDDHHVEYRMMSADGTIRWVEGRGMVFRDPPTHRPLRVLGISTDITERKRIEEALRL